MYFFSDSSDLNYNFDAWKNRLILTVLLSTHIICFGRKIRRLTCADPGIFVRGGGGGPGQSDKNKLWQRFFFLVLSLFYRSQMVNFKEIYHFSRCQRGPTFTRGGGGPTFSRGGGSNCLFPIETHITCDFPGGGPDPLSPLWICTWLNTWYSIITKALIHAIVILYLPTGLYKISS